MIPAAKLVGYFFQIAGMLVMLFAFVMLVIGIQGITGKVTSSIGQSAGVHSAQQQNCTELEMEEGACEDLSTPEGLNAALEKRIIEFVKWLAVGIILTLIGFALRAGDEIGGFWARLRNKDEKKVPVGLRWQDIS
jgi:hypothetical protein